MMFILLCCMFTLSSAYDLDVMLSILACGPVTKVPLTTIDANNSVALDLSTYCNNYTEIADCIEETANETSSNNAVRSFAITFDRNSTIERSVDLCKRIQDSDLASDLNCVKNVSWSPMCFFDWMHELIDINITDSMGYTEAASIFKSCVHWSYNESCSFQAATFMGDYASVLLVHPHENETFLMSNETASAFELPEDAFDYEGSAVLECSKTVIDRITNITNQSDASNAMSLVENVLDIVCGEKDKIVPCLKENMPDSNTAIDQIILLFVDLDGAGKVLDTYCSKRNLIAENFDCMSRNSTVTELKRCDGNFSFDNDLFSHGFALVDYMCSAIVDISKCYGEKVAQYCSSELGDLLTSTFENLLTPECLQAKPRPFVGLMQPGWSYTVVPGGMTAMECVLPTALELMTYFNDSDVGSEDVDIQSVVGNVLELVCKRADSIVTCLETKLPGGTSKIDGLTREVIDPKKLRAVKSSVCQNQNEIINLFPCFIDASTNTTQTKCFEEMGRTFMQTMGNVTAFTLILPGTFEKLKGLLCGGNSAFSKMANCEANAVNGCSSKLSEYVLEVLTGGLTDTCVGTKGLKGGASSIVAHSVVWLLVGSVALRYM